MAIHPTAVIHPKAQIGAECEIGPYCVIGENVKLFVGDTVIVFVGVSV